MKIKLCRDCVFYNEYDECHKQDKRSHTYSLVTGEEIHVLDNSWRDSASLQRQEGFLEMFLMNSCGKVGRWWQPKGTV